LNSGLQFEILVASIPPTPQPIVVTPFLIIFWSDLLGLSQISRNRSPAPLGGGRLGLGPQKPARYDLARLGTIRRQWRDWRPGESPADPVSAFSLSRLPLFQRLKPRAQILARRETPNGGQIPPSKWGAWAHPTASRGGRASQFNGMVAAEADDFRGISLFGQRGNGHVLGGKTSFLIVTYIYL